MSLGRAERLCKRFSRWTGYELRPARSGWLGRLVILRDLDGDFEVDRGRLIFLGAPVPVAKLLGGNPHASNLAQIFKDPTPNENQSNHRPRRFATDPDFSPFFGTRLVSFDFQHARADFQNPGRPAQADRLRLARLRPTERGRLRRGLYGNLNHRRNNKMPYVKKDATMYTHVGTTVSGDFLVDRVEKPVMTMNELYINQSPNTNFEMSKTLLLQRALDKGFVTCVGIDRYEVNLNYNRPADGSRFMTREEIEQQVDQLSAMDLEDDKND